MTTKPTLVVPEWLFGLVVVPFGVTGAFSTIVVGRILTNAGIPVGRVSAVLALSYVPSTFQFLWAPVVDVGMRRRSWVVLLALLGSVCLATALLLPLPERLGLFGLLVIIGQGLVGLTSSCTGALMALFVPPERLGKVGAWSNIGNVAVGPLSAFVALEVASHFGRHAVAVVIVPMVVLPSLVALTIPEVVTPARALGLVFRETLSDVWNTVRSRSGWTGILLCASPVGTVALSSLFSSLGNDYHASDRMVNFVNGLWSGVITAAGCYVGGVMCDRMNRRRAYLLCGMLTVVCGLTMALGPLSPTTYAVGALVYLFITGIAYTAYTAFVLEIVGGLEGAAAATRYTLFTAAANGAIAYVIRLDGFGYSKWGPRGSIVTDAVANLGGMALLGVLFWVLAPARRIERGAALAPAAAAATTTGSPTVRD